MNNNKTSYVTYLHFRLNIEEKKTKSRESMGERGERPIYNDRMQGGRGERGSQVHKAEDKQGYRRIF